MKNLVKALKSKKKKYPASIFKAYDIRGIVKTELLPDTVRGIGNILGVMAKKLKIEALCVGYDGRLSSPDLARDLITGVLDAGCKVYAIGQVTTPMLYFANKFLKTDSGVMITGSHNPPEYNGFKMVLNDNALYGEQIQEIYQLLNNGEYYKHIQSAVCENFDIMEDYITTITSDIVLMRKFSLIVDAGNGVAGKIAPVLYRRLGLKVLGLFCDVDGNFPNHHPDPSVPSNLTDLIAALKASDAEVGFAFDGDGDRLGVVTKDGNIIYPDRQLMLFALAVLEKNPRAKIIYDVKSSRLLKKLIIENGGKAIMCRCGHSFVKAEIKKTGALLAGEMSGHIFFNDRWFGFDDGVYAGARLLEILAQTDDVTALLNALPNSIATPEINIKVKDGMQHKIIAKLQHEAKFPKNAEVITLDGVRLEYSDGFGLVRASNTTSVLVLRFEADNLEALTRIKNDFKQLLKKYVKIDEL